MPQTGKVVGPPSHPTPAMQCWLVLQHLSLHMSRALLRVIVRPTVSSISLVGRMSQDPDEAILAPPPSVKPKRGESVCTHLNKEQHNIFGINMRQRLSPHELRT